MWRTVINTKRCTTLFPYYTRNFHHPIQQQQQYYYSKRFFHASRVLFDSKKFNEADLNEAREIANALRNMKLSTMWKEGSSEMMFMKSMVGSSKMKAAGANPELMFHSLRLVKGLLPHLNRTTSKELEEEIKQAFPVVLAKRDFTEDLKDNPFSVLVAAIDHVTENEREKEREKINGREKEREYIDKSESNSEDMEKEERRMEKQAQAEANERRIREEHQAREAKKIEEELERERKEKQKTSTPPLSSSTSSSSSSSSSPSSTSSSPSHSPSSSSSSSSTSSSSSSSSSTSTSKSTRSSILDVPKIPWLINVDVDSLPSPTWYSYIAGCWYRQVSAGWREAWDFRPSRLLQYAKQGIEAFATNLQEGNLDNLRLMLAPHLYKHFENTLKTYQEKNITLTLDMKSIEDAFFTEYGFVTYCNPSREHASISPLPGTGTSFESSQSLLVRKRMATVGYAVWQFPDDGTSTESSLVEMANSRKIKSARSSIFFSVYVTCKEIFNLKDANGHNIIEGNTTPSENGHLFTFFTNLVPDVQWQIVDMNNFNSKSDDDIPIFAIEPQLEVAILKSYKH